MSAIASTPIDAEAKNAPTSGRLFFLDLSAGRILSANPDGSDLKTIINEGRKLPDGMVLDVAAGHIYWTNMELRSFLDRILALTWSAGFFSSRACLLLVLSFALLPACAWPQSELATVFGTVTDPSGAVIPAAQVTIVNQSTGLKRETVTDMTGQYHLAGLPTGSYVVRAGREGFRTQVREGVTLSSASGVMIDFSLVVGPQPQELTVSGDVNEIDRTTSTVSGLVAEQNLTELPLNSRDLFKAAIFAPGVAPTPSSAPSLLSSGNAGQLAINGMRPSWTDVRIDGMDANDPLFGYSPAGASGLFLGLNEFTEVRVLTQTSDVEYGRNGGGVIDVVTKSGSNHFHGSLFEIHREAALDSKNYFDSATAPIPPFVRNQFGAGVGGPLVHDRTFFYADYEGFREVQAVNGNRDGARCACSSRFTPLRHQSGELQYRHSKRVRCLGNRSSRTAVPCSVSCF